MKKVLLIALIISLFGGMELLSQVKSVATVQITFRGLRNNKGIVAIGLHNSPKGWHKKPEMEPNWSKENMKDGKLTVRIENLEYGTYAFSMMDDEDANLEMDKFMGLPREGFAFSRNPHIGMSVPNFEDCSFEVDTSFVELVVDVIYKGKGT